MTAVSDETGRQQAFERFPKLAGWIERLAGTQMDLSLTEWNEFLAELNAALSASPVAQEPVALDLETIQTLLDLLNPLHGSLDQQTYDEKLRENFDAPRDYEHHVTVTWGQEGDLTQAVRILEDRKKNATPPPTPAGLGADEIVRIADDLRSISDQTKTMHYKLISLGLDRAERSLRALALLSRAGDQSNSTQKDGSR